MIKGRKLDHIGLACTDPEADAAWYQDILGFTEIGKFMHKGRYVHFIQNGTTVYEIYHEAEAAGKIDHMAYVSEDIDSDYAFCVEQGYKITTEGIEQIDAFWEHGIRYFKIESPCGEQVEFVMKVKA